MICLNYLNIRSEIYGQSLKEYLPPGLDWEQMYQIICDFLPQKSIKFQNRTLFFPCWRSENSRPLVFYKIWVFKKFLRAPFLNNTPERLLLEVLPFTAFCLENFRKRKWKRAYKWEPETHISKSSAHIKVELQKTSKAACSFVGFT